MMEAWTNKAEATLAELLLQGPETVYGNTVHMLKKTWFGDDN